MIKQKVRVEVREDGWLNKMCEGSVTQAIAFLQAIEKDFTDQAYGYALEMLDQVEKEQTAQPDGQGKDTNPL
jgi:hypothetical protein